MNLEDLGDRFDDAVTFLERIADALESIAVDLMRARPDATEEDEA